MKKKRNKKQKIFNKGLICPLICLIVIILLCGSLSIEIYNTTKNVKQQYEDLNQRITQLEENRN